MTPVELAPILSLLAEALPGSPVTAATAEAYLAVLRDLRAADVEAAAVRHIASGATWRPGPGQLRALVVRARLGIADPEDVLTEVLRLIHDRGYNRPPKREDCTAVAWAVIESMGWLTLCESDNPEALRAHLLRIATRWTERVVTAGSLAALGMAPGNPAGAPEKALPTTIGDVVRGVLPPLSPRSLPPGKPTDERAA